MNTPLPWAPAQVDIREVGMRDGLQLEDPIPLPAKLDILEAIVATGVRRVEVTSFVSRTAVPALADAEELVGHLHRWPDVEFSALVAGLGGARRAVAAGMPHLEYVVSAADSHSQANAGRPTEVAAALMGEIVGLAHDAGGRCEISIATAWDCPFDGPTPVERTVELARRAQAAGADTVCLADTVGTTVPGRVVELIGAVREACEGLELGVHFHDTRGAGIANALMAAQLGVRQIDASVGGLGGCPFAPGATGNIATEELVYLFEGTGIATGLDLERLLEAASIVETAVEHSLPSRLYRAGGRLRPRGAQVGTPA